MPRTCMRRLQMAVALGWLGLIVYYVGTKDGGQREATHVFREDRAAVANFHQEESVVSTDDDLAARRQRVERVCARLKWERAHLGNNGSLGGSFEVAGSLPGYVDVKAGRSDIGIEGVFLDRRHRLAYCFVPKTGCTFWKKVFAFMGNSPHLLDGLAQAHGGERVKPQSPWELPRTLVHKVLGNGLTWARVKGTVFKPGFTRFMFSRDPYSRLWGAYLDKLHLPDFWERIGTAIVKKRAEGATEHDARCGGGVTFPEFLQFSIGLREPHWSPVSSVCDPCRLKPQILGEMSTYTRDAEHLLAGAGLGWVLQDYDRAAHVRNEIEMLVDFNLDLLRMQPRLAGNNCTDLPDIARRLWTVFQHNGYLLDSQVWVPPASGQPVTTEAYTAQVLEAFAAAQQRPGGAEMLKQQKRAARERAFSTVPKETLQLLARKYALDFEMFGYKPIL